MSKQATDKENKVHDLVIIGAGPAGLAAGIYSGRGGLDTVLLDMMGGAGLEESHYYNLAAGIVALHIGYKY